MACVNVLSQRLKGGVFFVMGSTWSFSKFRILRHTDLGVQEEFWLISEMMGTLDMGRVWFIHDFYLTTIVLELRTELTGFFLIRILSLGAIWRKSTRMANRIFHLITHNHYQYRVYIIFMYILLHEPLNILIKKKGRFPKTHPPKTPFST